MTFILLFISLLLYFFAPYNYSWDYCVACLIIFLYETIDIYRREFKKETMNFHILFSISFFFVNFVYPVFVYPTNSSFSLFRYDFNEHVISKCTGLALLAYTSYIAAYFYRIRRALPKTDCNDPIIAPDKLINILVFCSIVVFALFILNDGFSYYTDMYGGEKSNDSGIIRYIIVLLNPILLLLCICSNNVKLSCKRNMIRVFLMVIVVLLLFTGTRTLSLSLGILIAVQFMQRNKINLFTTITIIFLGVFCLSIVGSLRGVEVSDISELSKVDKRWYEYALDLIVNNRSLYVLYDYSEISGFTYGQSMLAPLLQPIPFFQSFVSKTFSLSPEVMKSSNIVTNLEFGPDAQFGLGTNMIGDVYLAFGLVGVVVMFCFLGWFVAQMKSLSFKSLTCSVIYYILVSNAVFMCRASYLYLFATIIWTVMFLKICSVRYKMDDIL